MLLRSLKLLNGNTQHVLQAMPEGRSFNCQFLNLTMAAQSPKYAEWAVGTLANASNGAMNPAFLEWLMGYPSNWTSTSEETRPWGMPLSPSKPSTRSLS